MNGSRLLDSNIVIDLFREDNATIEALKKFKSVYISVTVLGELFFGANASSRISERMVQVEAFSSKVSLLNCNKETARIYGKVKAQLKKMVLPYLKTIFGLRQSPYSMIWYW